jgi:formamidopyrimidine-DNA glycosylase
VDPLEASEEEFCQRLAGRRAMIKALLLNQRVLRGMGNIYADESLWRARIHPARHAARLARGQMKQLYRAIRDVLSAAIRMRGSSVSNYVDAEGLPGQYQQRHRVYGREGKACPRCGTRIGRVIVAGRSSYFCPRCQSAPRRHASSRQRRRARRAMI